VPVSRAKREADFDEAVRKRERADDNAAELSDQEIDDAVFGVIRDYQNRSFADLRRRAGEGPEASTWQEVYKLYEMSLRFAEEAGSPLPSLGLSLSEIESLLTKERDLPLPMRVLKQSLDRLEYARRIEEKPPSFFRVAPGLMASTPEAAEGGAKEDTGLATEAMDVGEQRIAHSEDFTYVHWGGQEFTFTPKQRVVVRKLWEARENGMPDVSHSFLRDAIQEELDLFTGRFYDVFRRSGEMNLAWGKGRMIFQGEGAKRGTLRINDPPRQ